MRYALFALLFIALSASALPLSKETRKEATLFNEFLETVYKQRKGDKNSFADLQKLLEKDPDSVYLKRLLVAQAVAQNHPEQATPYIDFIQQENPSEEDFQVYGAYQTATEDLEGAVASYEKALELNPESDTLLYQYVTALSGLDPDTAAQKLEKLADKYPSDASDIYVEAGRLYFYRSQWDKSLTYFDKALQLNPNNPNAYLGRGSVYEKQGRYFLMLHEFETLEKMGYTNPSILSRMASFYVLVRDLDKAEEYFLKTKQAQNDNPAAAYFLAVLSENRGDYSKALGFLRDSSDYSSSPNKQLQASFYLSRLNQPEESLKTLENAYQISNGNIEAGYFYVLALNDNHRYKQSASILKKILQTNPQYTDARLQYAFALEGLKKYKEMEVQLRQILETDPKNAADLNLWAYSLAERNIRLEEATQYITRALSVNPNDYSFMDTYAWILFKQGKLEQAADILTSIPQKVIAENAEIAYHLACIRQAQGNMTDTKKLLELAKSKWKPADKLYKKLFK